LSVVEPSVSHSATEPPGELPAETSGYALVHLVAQEVEKGLIETQVIDHMEVQATTGGPDAPARVSVLFLEPLRVVAHPRTIARRRMLARRAPHVDVRLASYVGRLGKRRNAAVLARSVKRLGRGLPTVLHCRGEAAVSWALAMRPHLPSAVIVADMRGIWPEEFLHARGYDSVESAAHDESAMAGYRDALAHIREAVKSADAMLAVSESLIAWLDRHVDQRPQAHVVPCCVSTLTSDERTRQSIRSELGVANKTVLCYVGTAARYQDIDDGFALFCAMAVSSRGPDLVHVLCLTPDVESVRSSLSRVGIPNGATTVRAVPQSSVAAYLTAADAGFLLRGNTEVNRVSVPVKLGEYLASGVPVVMSSLVEWNDVLLARSPAALSVDWFGVSDAVRERQVARVLTTLFRDRAGLRAEALSLAGRHFTWSAQLHRVRKTYRNALVAAASPNREAYATALSGTGS
jgi:glycosyltransferase involved in cell wall biosynthesis